MAAHLGLGQRIGEFGPPALPLLAQRLRLLVRSGAFACHLLRVERQAQPHFGTHYRRISLHGLLAVDTCILLVQQVDPLVEDDRSYVEPLLPQAAFGLAQRHADHLRHDDDRIALGHAHIERHPRTHLDLPLRPGLDRTAVDALFEHVVGRHIGLINEPVDLQSGDFEHILGLPERTPRHVGNLDLLLRERVDRHIDRAAALDLRPFVRQLVEHHPPS